MLKWRRIFSLRNRALLMVGLPLLSLLTAFAPIFTGSVSAITPDEVLNRARAWSILNAVIDKQNSLNRDIDNEDIDTCTIFNAAANIYVGAAVTGDPDVNEQTWADLEDNTGILNGALASVGIQRGCRGLLEVLGYTSNGSGLRKPDNLNALDRLRGAISANAFLGRNLGDGDPGPALSYALLYYNLTRVCGWSFRNSYTNNSDPTFKTRNDEAKVNGWRGDNRERHYHTYTYEEGKAGENTYYKGSGREDDVRVGSKTGFAPSGNNDAILDCGDASDDDVTFGERLGKHHRFADAYYALVRPGGDNTAGTCGDRYPIGSMIGAEAARQQARLDACDEGFRNKDTAGFCNKFTDPEQKGACIYGQGTATGGKDATTPPPGTGNNGESEESKPSCLIDGVGWILCPVITLLAKLTDGVFKIISDLLEVQPLNVNGDSGLYNAWSIMRNFANVTFVIAFLVIVFSQVTGLGINNYGIKKMLPRLVIAAILVNMSYWICAVAVDISNILGTSLYKLLVGAEAQIGIARPEGGIFSGDNGFANFAGAFLAGTIAGGALFYVTLSVLLPVLVAILATILSVFLVLILRQTLIIVLIVASPLIFATLIFRR